MTQTSTPATGRSGGPGPASLFRGLLGRITRFEIIVWAAIALIMLVLVLIEPNILEAPFENWQTLLFTFGGTALAAIAYGVMLWFRVNPVVRLIVLVVPFVIVNWWLISPYFRDEVVDEGFETSITEEIDTSEQAVEDAAAATPEVEEQSATEETGAASDEPASEETQSSEPAAGPVLLGAGQFVGLAGHEGTGDAAIFQNPDGSLVLRFENFDIENGPDLEVYLVPGADQVSLPEGSIHLGPLKGNIGDQNYELPPGTELAPGAYTATIDI